VYEKLGWAFYNAAVWNASTTALPVKLLLIMT